MVSDCPEDTALTSLLMECGLLGALWRLHLLGKAHKWAEFKNKLPKKCPNSNYSTALYLLPDGVRGRGVQGGHGTVPSLQKKCHPIWSISNFQTDLFVDSGFQFALDLIKCHFLQIGRHS